jgi:hypothetical protein
LVIATPALDSYFTAAAREHALVVQQQGVVERQLRWANLRVRVRVAGTELPGALLGPLLHRRDEEPGAVRATISVWEESACTAGALPFPWDLSDIEPGGLVRGPELDGVVAVHETYSGAVTLTESGRRAVLHRVPHRNKLPWWERAAPLRPSLFWALGGENRQLVHASAIGDQRGAVLLVGARGSGKTTVVLAALERGLGFVGDDYLLLQTTGAPVAFSVYSTVCVRAEPDARAKTVLDVAAQMPGSLRESLPIRAVVAPRICGGQADWRRVRPAVALRAWAPSTVFHMPVGDGAMLASLASAVRQLPCFQLDVGDNPAELASAVLRVLEQATS